MKNQKLYIITTWLLLLTLSITSCSDFFDINTSKDTPAEVNPEQLLPVVVFYSSQLCYDHAEYGVYLSQALTTGGRSQTSSYAYKAGWELLSMNRHPQWRRHFYDIGANGTEMIKAAEKIDSKNYILIGRTIILASTLLTTDAFGDIPRSQLDISNSPTYDTQESVYEWMNKEVDDLINLYNDPEWINGKNNKIITASQDRLFGGDLNKWRAYTKALKARLLLRMIPNWKNTPENCQKIIDAADAALNDPAYVDALYHYDGGTTEKNCPWGPAQPKLNLGWAQGRENLLTDAIPSKFFAYGLLSVYINPRATIGYALDPRAEQLMTPRVDDKGVKTIRYIENNIGMPSSMKITYYPDLYAPEGNNPYTRNNGYIMLMSKEELLFIKAEAQYWKGEKDNAYNTTVDAVKINMERVGVKMTDATVKGWVDRFFSVRLPGATTFTIADLMQQKYVAMYLQPEQWTDVRRYNYSSDGLALEDIGKGKNLIGSGGNGITYDGVFVYHVTRIHDGTRNVNLSNFTKEYPLIRPYNLYAAYWIDKADNFGVNAKLSPNAWITRLNYDPETEDKYNRKELERLGAYKNPEWLRKRMIWAYKNNNHIVSADPNIEWK